MARNSKFDLIIIGGGAAAFSVAIKANMHEVKTAMIERGHLGGTCINVGLSNDLSLTWDQRKEEWKLSGQIYKTQNFTQLAEGHKEGLWTSVISSAVLIL